MLDALLAGVIVDEAGALVRDFDARTIGCRRRRAATGGTRSEEHTSELQSLMRISYAVFCLKKKNTLLTQHKTDNSRKLSILPTVTDSATIQNKPKYNYIHI